MRWREEVVITKRGVPVAKLVPADPQEKFVLGIPLVTKDKGILDSPLVATIW